MYTQCVKKIRVSSIPYQLHVRKFQRHFPWNVDEFWYENHRAPVILELVSKTFHVETADLQLEKITLIRCNWSTFTLQHSFLLPVFCSGFPNCSPCCRENFQNFARQTKKEYIYIHFFFFIIFFSQRIKWWTFLDFVKFKMLQCRRIFQAEAFE